MWPNQLESGNRGSLDTVPKPPTAPTGHESDETLTASLPQNKMVGPPKPMSAPGHPPGPKMPVPREVAFMFVICSAQIMTQAGLSQLLPSHIKIANYFGVTDPGIQSWFIAAYSLTVGTFILISGRLGDLFGYKIMFVIGFVWFGIFSTVAGVSYYSNYILFCFARALQGIGPSILLPNGLALLGATYPPGVKKNLCFALFGASAPFGAWLGMIFAVYFSEDVWWPWSFFAQAIACIAFAGLAVLAIVSPPAPPAHSSDSKSLKDKLSRIDALGSLTGVTGLVCINIAWNQGPVAGWSQQYVYMLLILGVVILGAFFLIETRIATNPLLPLSSLTSDVSFVLAAVACGWANFGIWVYYFWQFLLTIRHVKPIDAAVQFIPIVPAGLVAAIATGICMSKLRPAVILFIALIAFTVSAILVATAPAKQTYWGQTFVSMCVAAFGMDMSFPAATVIMSNAVPRGHQGVAASLINTVVNYCVSIGLGIAATVEVNTNSGGRELLDGYRHAWYTGIGLSGFGVLITFVFLGKTVFLSGRGRGRRGESILAQEQEQEQEKEHGNGNGHGNKNGMIKEHAVKTKEKNSNRKSIRDLTRISWVPREKRVPEQQQQQNLSGSGGALATVPERSPSSRTYGDEVEGDGEEDGVNGNALERETSAEEAERKIPFAA